MTLTSRAEETSAAPKTSVKYSIALGNEKVVRLSLVHSLLHTKFD